MGSVGQGGRGTIPQDQEDGRREGEEAAAASDRHGASEGPEVTYLYHVNSVDLTRRHLSKALENAGTAGRSFAFAGDCDDDEEEEAFGGSVRFSGDPCVVIPSTAQAEKKGAAAATERETTTTAAGPPPCEKRAMDAQAAAKIQSPSKKPKLNPVEANAL